MEPSESPFLTLPYPELEKLNLKAKAKRTNTSKHTPEDLKKYYKDYLKKEKRIKAVTVAFSDLEGRFYMLDYDKKFLLSSSSGLTFDGSSVRGFADVDASDLRLKLDWGSFYWLPAKVFGPGKVLVFANIYNRDGTIHSSDFRARLKVLAEELFKKEKMTIIGAPEIEGILVEGASAEVNFDEKEGFGLASSGGYYHSLPLDPLRQFIDKVAEAQRALGFENEKDHPEVAPSQFELNFRPSEICNAADLIQIYKLISRQVAEQMGYTATFLPKPMMGINGSGMHTNLSFQKNGRNLFYDKKDKYNFSKFGYDFVERILTSAHDISLILNPSVNAYRRLDPNFEAPNQIKSSPIDRTSMIRLPLASEKGVRVEIRSVAPDVNPYMLMYSLIKVGLEGPKPKTKIKKARIKTLPGNIYDAIRVFKASKLTKEILGQETAWKYTKLKEASAYKCPRELGTTVKRSEIIYHHEVTNQYLWSRF